MYNWVCCHSSLVKTPLCAGNPGRWRMTLITLNQMSQMWRFWDALTTASVTFGTCASPWTSGRRSAILPFIYFVYDQVLYFHSHLYWLKDKTRIIKCFVSNTVLFFICWKELHHLIDLLERSVNANPVFPVVLSFWLARLLSLCSLISISHLSSKFLAVSCSLTWSWRSLAGFK